MTALPNVLRPELGPEPPAGACRACGGAVRPVPGWRGWLAPEMCEPCAGRMVAQQEARERQQRTEDLLALANLPPLALKWHFRRASQEADSAAFRAVYAWEYGPEGLFLWGPVGTGKTVLAWCLLLREIRRHNRTALFLHVPDFLAELRRGFGERSASRDLADQAKKTAVLCLDDLGAEKPTEWVREVLLAILDHRMTHERPTVGTSNYTPGSLHRHLQDETGRLVDRLVGACRLVEVPGESFRQREAEQRANGGAP
ncbi:MAG: ATP-binding protein [Deltaproteobacteria bacterium]|nr:ATP-binding protein [Deltaproteobacteria bacterium]